MKIALSQEPPAPEIQRAMWDAADASGTQVSKQEAQHISTRPGDDASEDEMMLWRMDLLRIRQEFPMPPSFVYKGRIIRKSTSIPPDLALPKGVPSWVNYIPLRCFHIDEEQAHSERYADYHQQVSFQLTSSGAGIQASAKSSLPRLPQDASEYFALTERNREYMVATNRWSSATASFERMHVRDIMQLFRQYPFKDVLQYDDDFRFKRHRFQDAARSWASRDQAIFDDRLAGKALQRAEIAAEAVAAGAGAVAAGNSGGAAGVSSRRSTTKASTTPDFFDRPCYKKVSVRGKACCAKWNWGIGCADCSPDMEGEGCDRNMRHICCFCNELHQVKDCPDFKRLHPQDLAKGYKN